MGRAFLGLGDSALDSLHSPSYLGCWLSHGRDDIDHCYLIAGDPSRRIARIHAPDYTLSVATDAPGLQVFTGKPGLIALEPEIHPDAPNHDAFPSIVLRPGRTFGQTSRWTVTPV